MDSFPSTDVAVHVYTEDEVLIDRFHLDRRDKLPVLRRKLNRDILTDSFTLHLCTGPADETTRMRDLALRGGEPIRVRATPRVYREKD